MTLVGMRRDCPSELRADFQRYYRLNLDDMGHTFTILHAADLAANLPEGSAVWAYHNPKMGWTHSDYMLSRIEYWLHAIVHGLADSAHASRDKVELMQPGEKKETTVDVEHINERLAKKHKVK